MAEWFEGGGWVDIGDFPIQFLSIILLLCQYEADIAESGGLACRRSYTLKDDCGLHMHVLPTHPYRSWPHSAAR